MKAVKWILVTFAFVAIVFFTVPSGIFCSHSYSCTDNVCTKCGNFDLSKTPSHTWQTLSCSKAQCTVCGKTDSGNYHTYKNIPCTDSKKCTVCHQITKNTYGESHNKISIKDGCTSTLSCTDCGKVFTSVTSHKWVSTNCENDYYCKNCGTTNYPTYLTGHLYNTSVFSFGFIEACNYCGDFHFRLPNAFGICAFIGLLMGIAGLVFLLVNRKRIRVPGGMYFQFSTPEAHVREDEVRKHMF